MINAIISAYVEAIGGRAILLQIFSLPIMIMLGFVFYKISHYGS